MELSQLTTFVEVANLKSFSKAAKELYLTQPSVSAHIALLEKELNVKLFNRQTKTPEITEAGKILYKYAVDILNTKQHIEFSLANYSNDYKGTLVIAASSIPKNFFLNKVILKFSKDYPEVKYRLPSCDSQQVVDMILRSQIDFGIVGSKNFVSTLVYEPLFSDEVVLVSAYANPLEKVENLETLKSIPLVSREKGSGSREVVDNALKGQEIRYEELNSVIVADDNETIRKMVEKSSMVSFMSERAVEREVKQKILKKIPVDKLQVKRDFYFVYDNRREISPISELFKNYVLEEVNEKK